MSIRVLIVEDDPHTRSQLVDKVSSHPELEVADDVGSVADGKVALERGSIDVALIDLGLPDGDGTELIRLAVACTPPVEVMVMTVFGDERHVIGAIEAGATGYLLKDAEAQSVAGAILELLAGGSPISSSIARHLLRRFRAPPEDTTHSAAVLTPREVEVLTMVSRGFSNNEIANLLGTSFHTVTSHIKHIYRKLSVRSRSEAIFEAVQQGIITMDRDPYP